MSINVLKERLVQNQKNDASEEKALKELAKFQVLIVQFQTIISSATQRFCFTNNHTEKEKAPDSDQLSYNQCIKGLTLVRKHYQRAIIIERFAQSMFEEAEDLLKVIEILVKHYGFLNMSEQEHLDFLDDMRVFNNRIDEIRENYSE